MNTLAEKVRRAGVVGCGGAGFPAYVKVNARAEYVIANGAECEPLLRVDQQLMIARARELIAGLEMVGEAVGAKKLIIGLKKKYTGAIETLKTEISRRKSPVELFLLGSYYPAGDEHVLLHEVTGRVIPEGGLPLDVGVVVSNVGTLINICRAAQLRPVIHRFLTVAGEVRNPVTLPVPVGAFIEDVLAAAGGAVIDDYVVIEGGPIMGEITTGPVTKKTTGLIVLPPDHKQIRYKQRPLEIDIKKAAWACDQCRYCTDYCPRFLLGHRLEPHIIMRLVGQQRWDCIPEKDLASAYLCCQCGVCGMYACPVTLSPDRVIAALLGPMKESNFPPMHNASDCSPHPFRDGRKIPISRYAARIDVARYEHPAPLREEPLSVSRVRIPLKQHVGAPCRPLVKVGQNVEVGEKIGDIGPDDLGVPIHASISGTVEHVFDDSIFIRG